VAGDETWAASASAQWSQAFAGATLAAMRAYDTVLARLFTPWAHDLVDRVDPPRGCSALDVAAGPGTVALILAARIGRNGHVTAADISPAMLEIARSKPVADGAAAIDWVEAPAAPLPVPDASVDVVTCQQGLQFFPDKVAALAEMRRALRSGGRAGLAIWTQIEDQVFRHLHDAVSEVVSAELAARYLGPFLLSGEQAAAHARAAGFEHVELERVTLPAVLPGGAQDIVATLPAAGIAADIAALEADKRAELLAEVTRRTASLRDGDAVRDSMTASVLILS
jgi:ubiquinone/menaquinone biosynthesis C-methylase UbiE